MLNGESQKVSFKIINIDRVKQLLHNNDWTSAIGHEDVAIIVSKELGMEVKHNRISHSLEKEDVLILRQYFGGRLPEGTTTLNEDQLKLLSWVEITLSK